jgi:hypothetical protein
VAVESHDEDDDDAPAIRKKTEVVGIFPSAGEHSSIERFSI